MFCTPATWTVQLAGEPWISGTTIDKHCCCRCCCQWRRSHGSSAPEFLEVLFARRSQPPLLWQPHHQPLVLQVAAHCHPLQVLVVLALAMLPVLRRRLLRRGLHTARSAARTGAVLAVIRGGSNN